MLCVRYDKAPAIIDLNESCSKIDVIHRLHVIKFYLQKTAKITVCFIEHTKMSTSSTLQREKHIPHLFSLMDLLLDNNL